MTKGRPKQIGITATQRAKNEAKVKAEQKAKIRAQKQFEKDRLEWIAKQV